MNAAQAPGRVISLAREVTAMRKILLVIDMQNDFINGALGTPEAMAIVNHVAEEIKKYPASDIIAHPRHPQ